MMPRVLWRAFLAFLLASAGFAGSAEEPDPLRIHFLSGSKEYQSEASLKRFMADLQRRYDGVVCTSSWGEDKGESLDNLDPLAEADLMVVFCRRLDLPEDQMAIIRNHWESGKPVIGIRTASHPFQEADNEHFDRTVLGNHYAGHYGGEEFEVKPVAKQKDHPVLKGVGPITSQRLYKADELAPTALVLQSGDIGEGEHPVTIVNRYKDARMFYTSLGVPGDFKDSDFLRLLRNAVFWTTGRDEGKYRKK